MNIYIFGTKQYASDIFDELEKNQITTHLGGQIKVINDADELLDIIKIKSRDDIFLIDDSVIAKENRKNSLFSYFSNKKALIDEKDIDNLVSSTFEVNSFQELTSQILEEINRKAQDEINNAEGKVDSYDNNSLKQEDIEIEDLPDDLDFIDESNLQIVKKAIKEEEIPEAKEDIKEENQEIENLEDIIEKLDNKDEIPEPNQEIENFEDITEKIDIKEENQEIEKLDNKDEKSNIDKEKTTKLLEEDKEKSMITENDLELENDNLLDELNSIDESTILEAFNNNEDIGKTELEKPSNKANSLSLTTNTDEQISALTNAFENLLKNNKKIKITLEVLD
jgi:hypothetical protein